MFDKRDALRVEVKTASTLTYKSFYSFNCARGSRVKKVVNKDDCDILALVAADIKSVIFYPVSEIKFIRKRCKARDFINETESLRYSIKKTKENK